MLVNQPDLIRSYLQTDAKYYFNRMEEASFQQYNNVTNTHGRIYFCPVCSCHPPTIEQLMLAFCNQPGLLPAYRQEYTHMSSVCSIKREVDVYVAMARTREIAQQLGFEQIDRTRIEIAVLELARNILVHAGSGEIEIRTIDGAETSGIQIEARDHGPGIADIELAMRDGFSTAHTLGAGLPGVRRLMDTFVIESTVGVGTSVRAAKWLKSTKGVDLRGKRT